MVAIFRVAGMLRIVRPRTIRQHLLPTWLLKGFARGTGEAAETTWCHTADGVSATTLGLAGSADDCLEDPIPKVMVRFLDKRRQLYEAAVDLLRSRPPAEIVDKPPVAANLLADLGLRLYTVRLVSDREWETRIRQIESLLKMVASKPAWAAAMKEDAKRYGVDAVVRAAGARRANSGAEHKPSRPGPYRGSTKALLQFWRALDEASEEGHVRVELPDMTRIHALWLRKLRRARHRAVEAKSSDLVLGDVGMLVRYEGHTDLQPFEFERTRGIAAVFLPVSSERLLVASMARSRRHTAVSIDKINEATAVWSNDFFVSSRRSPHHDWLRSVIGAGWETRPSEDSD